MPKRKITPSNKLISKQRRLLAASINSSRIVIALSCRDCQRSSHTDNCKWNEVLSRKCGRYVAKNLLYNILVTRSEFNKLLKEREKIEAEIR